jgi:Zn-dependent M28 family amino/carboxypeptidase
MKARVLAATIVFAAFTLAAGTTPPILFDGESWWAHVKILADDNMEGRETGSDALKRAQAYAVKQFEKAGLQPAGTDGFYQHVTFTVREIDEKDSSLTLVRDGKDEPLVLGEDAYFSTRVHLAPEVNAPLVFVGYGLQVPEKNYDDLAGLDLKGKVAVLLAGSPAETPSALASHYQSAGERWKYLKRAGVVGIIGIPNPSSMDIPWSRMSLNRAHPAMDLAGAEFQDTAGEQLAATFNPAQADKLFAGSGHTFAELAALAKDRKPLPRFPLLVSIKARAKIVEKTVQSANLVAVLPGTDPKLKSEFVVLSAHLDHIGIGEPINGDRIYNGAMDNGSGSALLLDIAASFKSHPEKLRRSIIFLSVTAEEKGLLGSRYFAAHPSVGAGATVADINVDMFLPIVPLKVLKVLGFTDSDLGDRVRQIAESYGVQVQPDPEPLRNSFIRSDQYSFIRHGIPSVKMDVGFIPGSPEQQIFKDWLTNRYHAPSDDLDQPVDLHAAALYESIVRQLLINIANDEARPEWKPDSFFRRFLTQQSARAAQPTSAPSASSSR